MSVLPGPPGGLSRAFPAGRRPCPPRSPDRAAMPGERRRNGSYAGVYAHPRRRIRAYTRDTRREG